MSLTRMAKQDAQTWKQVEKNISMANDQYSKVARMIDGRMNDSEKYEKAFRAALTSLDEGSKHRAIGKKLIIAGVVVVGIAVYLQYKDNQKKGTE